MDPITYNHITPARVGPAEDATTRRTRSPESNQLLRLSQIVGKDGLLPISRAKFYELVKQGILPKPIKLSARISCWRRADILGFINDREIEGADHEKF